MIIHSPIISGSLTFADGATFTLPDNGIYSGSFSGSLQVHEVQSSLIPDSSASYDLGSEAFPFRDLYVSSNTIKLGGIGIGAGIGGLNIKNNSDGSPAEVAAKSITIGGLLGGVGSKKFKLNANNKIEVRDENDDIDSIEVKEIILKDTSGNGKNTVVKNDGGRFTTSEVNDSGTVTAVDSEGSLSGSFTGSVLDLTATGDATFNDAVTVSGLSSLDGGIDVDGAFTVADTSGNVSTSGTLSVTGVSSFGVISGSNLDLTGNIDIDGTATIGGTVTVDGHILPALHNTYDLGSTTKYWRDLYLSSGSLYINGIQVLSTDGTDLTFQTDAGESVKILETGNDTITLESVNGDITLTATGTGNIELDAPIQIAAGKNILSSDGNAISFASDVNLGSNDIYAANLVGVVSSSAITYDGNNIDVAGNTTIQGNLTVQGTQVQLNTTTLNIEDKNLLIASGAVDSAAANGGGITIDGADASITWVSGDSNIAFNTAVNIPASSLKLDGTAVTSTAAELNILDGATLTTTELNYVDGVTSNIQTQLDTLAGTDIGVTLTGAVTGTGTITNLGDVSIATTATADPTLTIDGDASGTATFTNLGDATLTLTITDDSHNHTIANVDGLQTALDAKQATISGGTGVTVSSNTVSIGQAVATNSSVTFATVSATGDIVAYASSDERLKDNIEVISNPIEKVQQLKGVTWDWNDNADELQKSLPNVGVIAQDVEKVLPQLVKDRDNGFKGVDYDKLVGLLIEAVKDQQTQIDELKSKLS